jgi:uncharacterized lipoprotein YddW (UPF0748 family)
MLLLAALLAFAACDTTVAPIEDEEPDDPTGPVELRGVWLTNVDSDVLNSREKIAEAMAFLAEHHFNVVYPVVWNSARTTYPSAVMDTLTGVRIDPRYAGRDPLQEIVEEAARHGIAVIPWFEYGFAASFGQAGGPILQKYPQWAERDAQGRLLSKNGFVWMNAFHPEVQNLLTQLMVEVASRYRVAGVQGDDRLPALPVEGGYSEFTRALYRAEFGVEPPDLFRRPEWVRWRADRLTEYWADVYARIKFIDPDLQVSCAPSPHNFGYREYLQDWPEWVNRGLCDQVHPQVYRTNRMFYEESLRAQLPAAVGVDEEKSDRFYPGILTRLGGYVVTPEFLIEKIQLNRELGFQGEVHFFYEALRANDNELAVALKESVYREKAVLPFRLRR